MNQTLPIIAYHIVFGAYGFWLPNDPRGSWSKYVWSNRLQAFGPATKDPARHPDPQSAHDAETRRQAKQELKYPPVVFTGQQALAVALGFREIISKLRMAVYAAALMPDHVHVVVAQQNMFAEKIAGHLKRAASRQLSKSNLHPLAKFMSKDGSLPTPWEEEGWKVFLHTHDDVVGARQYVNDNPEEAGFKRQNWSFITPYPA
jgi:REP element-mobilizing transposase RayT